MKTSILRGLVLSAIAAGTFAFSAQSTEAAVQINPINNISSDFIKGADVSMLPEMEKLGAKFYDTDGTQMDELQIMKNHGVNWIRLRIWNNPKEGPGGGGNTDEARALEMTKRAKALGMKVLIDFHYSDWWADPGKQVTPKAWQGHSKDQLVKDVYNYTKKVMQNFQKAGVQPEMIQIGNEVKSGMLWPIGQLPSQDGDKAFSELMASGLKAIRDCDPDHKTKLMVHLPDGGDNAFYRNFFDTLINKNGVGDFDVIGLSYYPFWHGPMANLRQNLNDISARYNKDVIVVETAFGYTNENFDNKKNCYGPDEERIGGFRSTVQGQASGLRAVMEALADVPNGRGTGMFYWEPDWYAVDGAGWKTGEGNEWDNLAMFDKNGKALDSWDVYRDVSDKNGKVVKATVKDVDEASVHGSAGQVLELPDKIRVTYTDDHAENMPVKWEKANPVYNEVGNYTVKGMVEGINKPTVCNISVIKKPINLVKNADFEKVTLDNWTITGDKGAIDAISKAGDSLGQGSMHYWSDKAFAFKATQEITGLKDGKYTVAVSTQGGGGQFKYQLFVVGDNDKMQSVNIKDDGWNHWQTWEIKDVEVKNGKATIGVIMEATPGNWGSLDNFEFYRQD